MAKNTESKVDSLLRRLKDLTRYVLNAPAANKRLWEAINMIEDMCDEKKLVRDAFQDYVRSEGCSCCQDYEAHKEAGNKLGKLLNFKPYSDGSGYDFYERKDRGNDE